MPRAAPFNRALVLIGFKPMNTSVTGSPVSRFFSPSTVLPSGEERRLWASSITMPSTPSFGSMDRRCATKTTKTGKNPAR